MPSFIHRYVFSFLDSGIVNGVVLQDLLAYVSSEHSYLRDLPQRQPQKMNSIEFVELERLQPDILVHAVLRVVDITVLTGKYLGGTFLILDYKIIKIQDFDSILFGYYYYLSSDIKVWCSV